MPDADRVKPGGVDVPRAQAAVREFLVAIGEDPERAGLLRTPQRVAEAAVELFAGIGVDPLAPLRAARFPVEDPAPVTYPRPSSDAAGEDGEAARLEASKGEPSQPVLLRDLAFRSMCEHHLLPFTGRVHLAYVPGDSIVGFGRLHTLLETLSSRPTLQERLGDELVDSMMAALEARGAVAVIEAVHGCAGLRGSRQESGTVVTVSARGELTSAASRAEIMALIGAGAGAATGSGTGAGSGTGVEAGALSGIGSASGRVELRDRAHAGVASASASASASVAAPERDLDAAKRPRVLGILNVTPDSFSDGGAFEDLLGPHRRTQRALQRARELVAHGADIIDIGGESTRPGAVRVPQEEESARVLPVVAELATLGVSVSIDTMYAKTAEAALALGAQYVNDVSGGLADPGMLELVAASGSPFILSHWRGHSIRMNDLADYRDPAAEILAELAATRDRAVDAGLDPAQIVLDPGLGFAKRRDDNWAVLRELDRFVALGHPLLIGASRKRFTGEVLRPDAVMTDRDLPTALITALAARLGIWGVRVHNVEANRVALDVVDAWREGAQHD